VLTNEIKMNKRIWISLAHMGGTEKVDICSVGQGKHLNEKN